MHIIYVIYIYIISVIFCYSTNEQFSQLQRPPSISALSGGYWLTIFMPWESGTGKTLQLRQAHPGSLTCEAVKWIKELHWETAEPASVNAAAASDAFSPAGRIGRERMWQYNLVYNIIIIVVSNNNIRIWIYIYIYIIIYIHNYIYIHNFIYIDNYIYIYT